MIACAKCGQARARLAALSSSRLRQTVLAVPHRAADPRLTLQRYP